MSNRRTAAQRAGRRRAPKDSTGVFEDAAVAISPRSKLQWAIFGAKLFVGLVFIVSAAGALAWGVHRYAQTTPRFAISDIEIDGTKRLARDDVLGTAGVKKGQNLFSLDVERSERQLLQSPWISAARVTRKLPGTVRIEVSERSAAALTVIAGKTFLVDDEGTPFKKMGLGDPRDLPVVTGISVSALSKNQGAEVERLRESLGLLRIYEKMAVAAELPAQEVHLDETGRAVLIVGHAGTAFHLGSPPFKKKLLRAARVLKKTAQAGGKPSVVFLDSEAHPERVVVRVR